jgi:hypothetical protein
MKLAFMPMFIVIIGQYFIIGDDYLNLWGSGLIVAIVATFLIPVLYYPIRFILKKEIATISISLYFFCIICAFVLEYYLLTQEIVIMPEICGLAGLIAIIVVFGIFTYHPPRFFLYKDPISRKYGHIERKPRE